MKNIKFANYDDNGYFLDVETRSRSSLQLNGQGTMYFPKNSTETLPPPDLQEGYRWRWEEGEWRQEIEPISEPIPEPEQTLEIKFFPDRFLLNCLSSRLYFLAKISSDEIVQIERAEVQAIINGRLIFMPETIAPGGLLQTNLQDLVFLLGDDATEEAIAEFNQILKDDLGVDWEILGTHQ